MLRGNQEFVDQSVTAESLLYIGKNGDLSDTKLVARDGAGRVRWLEQDQIDGKIWSKHGTDLLSEYDTIQNKEDAWQILQKAIKNSDSDTVVTTPNPPKGGLRYYIKVDGNPEPIRVAVSENGFIVTMFPDENAIGLID